MSNKYTPVVWGDILRIHGVSIQKTKSMIGLVISKGYFPFYPGSLTPTSIISSMMTLTKSTSTANHCSKSFPKALLICTTSSSKNS